MDLLRYVGVGLAAGWVIGKIRRGEGYGIFGNLLVGAIGSVMGWFLSGFLKIQTPNILAQIAMAVAGAIVFFVLVGFIKPNRRKQKKAED